MDVASFRVSALPEQKGHRLAAGLSMLLPAKLWKLEVGCFAAIDA
jgi:hypothetical protein